MFSMKKSEARLEAIIGPNTEFEGNIRTNEGLRVDGKIKGGINAEAVIIGEHGIVLGDIHANKVIIGGKVKGNISAANHLELMATGQVLGDLRTSKLIISDGGRFEGNCQMIKTDGKVVELNPEESSDDIHGHKNLKVIAGAAKK